MRQIYNKLVRDHIPAIIAASGRTCEVATLDTAAYAAALRAKLVEEAHEAAAPDADLVTELADVLEVLEALAATAGLDLGAVQAVQAARRAARGGFGDRVALLWTE
jgi:predicted house-cleaning noncanonical NTP pyrophosphatase (MazG superfamily)